MDVAVASLDRGVHALFAPSATFSRSTFHPLCECILQQTPPPDWRYLRRYPVLKRHVLRQFQCVAVKRKETPLTPRKRKKPSILQQCSDTNEYKALCLASLCQKLAQCELLTLDDVELVETVITLEPLEVLRRVIDGKMLPLKLKMLLLASVLQSQQDKCSETAVQSWIQQVCEKLLEEILEATASGTLSEPPSKRTRARSGDRNAAEQVEEKEKSCKFCRDGALSAETFQATFREWDFLVECTHQIARKLEKVGESYASNQTLVALSAFWELSSAKIGRRRKRSEISVTSVKNVQLSVPLTAYEKIVEIVVGPLEKTNAFQMMWTSVWKRHFKYLARSKRITLADTVCHCSNVDAFASLTLLSKVKEPVTHLPGLCIVLEVIRSLRVDVCEIIAAFAHVWGSADSGAFAHVPTSAGMKTSSMKRILQSYLSEILKSSSLRHEVTSSLVPKASAASRMSPLDLLSFLYDIFLPVSKEQQDGYCFKHWDALMAQVANEASREESTREGIVWCLYLEKCALCAEHLTTTSRGDNFLRVFQRYCHAIMYGIVVTGGEVITSGGSIHRPLVCEESDCSAVQQVLVQMMISFGEDWITELVAQLLRGNASLSSTVKFNQRGTKTLFFPALVSYMKSINKTNPKRRKTGQQQFAAIVHSVNVAMNESEPTSLYLVSLLRFCEAWDSYQSSHTKEAPTGADRWGFRAIAELDILPQLLQCYSKDEVIHQETSEALMFAAEVLQNTRNCPQTLEESLFKILAAVKAGAEHGKSTTSKVLAAIDQELVSHSSVVLQRLLRAVRFANVRQVHQLMRQIKDTIGTLGNLRQQLERWFSFVETNGAAFAGKESRLELSLLCTRLIRWFPNEFENMRFLLMTPLDSHLVFALKAYVKEAGRTNNKTQSVLSFTTKSTLPSAVRVEMALHLYLSAAAFPDLETLTVLLTKAIVKCRSRDAFDHLTKVAKKNGRILLPETAVATLSSPLRGLEFLATQQDEDGDDDEHIKSRARRAKSIIYQENTLKLLAGSASIFVERLSWSSALFDERSAVIWLPYLFEYVLETAFCEGTLRAGMLMDCLDELIQRANIGKNALQEAYWLAALLNTALIACSSRSAGAYVNSKASISNRLRAIVRDVLQLLTITSNAMTTQMTGKKSGASVQFAGIVGLLNSSKFARLVIKEERVGWSCDRFVSEKAGETLHTIVSAAWNAQAKPSQAAVIEPSIQLFVPFSHWLSGALAYSQSFLEESSATMRRWERTFTSYVTDLYLPLEFEGVACDLLGAWLTTWITSNITRGQDEAQLLALLPSQVALFRHLELTPYRGSSYGKNRDSTSFWQLVFVAINLAVDTAENPVAIEQAIELVVSTLTTLELVELSASSDFVPFSHVQHIAPFFQEVENFLSRSQLGVCSAAQVCRLLQHPLELLVCCYACKIPASLVAESQLFLQRVQKVLHKLGDDTRKWTQQDSLHLENESSIENTLSRPASAMNRTEIEAFYEHWADEMVFKYDYVDRERCAVVLEVIQAAMVPSNS